MFSRWKNSWRRMFARSVDFNFMDGTWHQTWFDHSGQWPQQGARCLKFAKIIHAFPFSDPADSSSQNCARACFISCGLSCYFIMKMQMHLPPCWLCAVDVRSARRPYNFLWYKSDAQEASAQSAPATPPAPLGLRSAPERPRRRSRGLSWSSKWQWQWRRGSPPTSPPSASVPWSWEIAEKPRHQLNSLQTTLLPGFLTLWCLNPIRSYFETIQGQYWPLKIRAKNPQLLWVSFNFRLLNPIGRFQL